MNERIEPRCKRRMIAGFQPPADGQQDNRGQQVAEYREPFAARLSFFHSRFPSSASEAGNA